MAQMTYATLPHAICIAQATTYSAKAPICYGAPDWLKIVGHVGSKGAALLI